jgi:murein L,D-transpeptidase YafK
LIAIALVGGVTELADAQVPENSRSRAAVERVEPGLSEDLKGDGLSLGAPIFIRIFKQESELEVWLENGSSFELFRTYPICTYSGSLGPKLRQGDWQAPEGFYFVGPQQMNPSSRFHLSFNLGYPNAYDRAYGRTGDFLMVHGRCVSVGCYAMTDPVIEEIWTLADAAFRGGQPFFRVHIFPFRMTADKMARRRGSQWAEFWRNLKEGYDWFERSRRPPNVTVRQKRYEFGR